MAFSKPVFSPIFRSPIILSNKITRISANNSNHGLPIPSSAQAARSRVLENEILDNICNRRFKKLTEAKNAFRKVLEEDDDHLSLESLEMIDSVQRLGIEYHFQDEINEVLENHYKKTSSGYTHQKHDLSQVAIRFRLLRQQGYCVPADVFKKFKNKEGKFKQELACDIKGLMELYEASQLSVEGEDILDEARVFSGPLLSASTLHLDDYQAGIVLNTLKNPFHKNLARSMVIKNLKLGSNKSEDVFMELAKLDFNMFQSFHRDEIVHISKWWRNKFGFAAEMKFGREEPLEWLSWPLATLADPNLSAQRVELAKVVSLFHLIQDVFYFYGSIDQLTLFVQAVNRWDIAAAKDLPEYMIMCLRALYEITDEIAHKIYTECGYNPKRSLQNAWIKLCNAFLGTAKWAAVGQLPKAEYYLKIANDTSAVNVVLVHIFFLLGEALTMKTINLVDNDPGIISSAASIFCLSGGPKITKDEDRNGGSGSYMKCYMRQYPFSSVQEAKMHTVEMISNKWKQLNKQCLSPNPFSPCFNKAALNCARLAPLMCGFDNNENLPSLQKHMKSLLFERIAI
ncbi:hypothetical protein JCGZ_02816 [Jatropha curcas]|uniref:Uncharacterized protein n=1 Tax=Jatropha curcas TaxID=180498 RepID=A0A067L548_JATCU|nr:probable terpene synthase 4 [Jatropha curcas]KDP42343.1 hypothetical protein JCGZ_02816 [Jatropha curcas]